MPALERLETATTNGDFSAPLPPASAPAHRVAALDGIRGVAILMVLVWHYYICVPRTAWFAGVPFVEDVAAYGWTGVPLFFVLSGFLIGRILIGQRGKPGYYPAFFVRRAARILPLYFFCLAAYWLARVLCPASGREVLDPLFQTNAPLWSYGVFLQNFAMAQSGTLGGHWLSVTWSLALEEQFYLVLPFVVAVCRPRFLPLLMLGVVGLALVFRWVVLTAQLGHPGGLIVLLPSRMDAFAIGVLLATQFERLAAWRGTAWLAGAGAIACLSGLICARANSIGYLATLYTLVAGVFGFLILHAVTSARGPVVWLLHRKALIWCGSISFFVYLFHQPINHLTHFFLRDVAPDMASREGIAITAVSLALVLVAGELSRRFLEAPIIAWGKRWKFG